MSRSGYSEDIDEWALIRWRGAVSSAIRGSRGQAMLRELAEALDAMPDKRLISGKLESSKGVCAMGCLGRARNIDMKGINADNPDQVATIFNIAPALAQEISYINDEEWEGSTPEQRWATVRIWISQQLKVNKVAESSGEKRDDTHGENKE